MKNQIKVHELEVERADPKNGLWFIVCRSCSYAAIAPVDENGVVKVQEIIVTDNGEAEYVHAFIDITDEMPEIDFSGHLLNDTED